MGRAFPHSWHFPKEGPDSKQYKFRAAYVQLPKVSQKPRFGAILSCPLEPRDARTSPVPLPWIRAGSVTCMNLQNVVKMMLCWFRAYGLRRPSCSAFVLLGALSHHARPAVLERPSGEQVDLGQQDYGTRKTERLTDLNTAIRMTTNTAQMSPGYDSKTVSKKKKNK